MLQKNIKIYKFLRNFEIVTHSINEEVNCIEISSLSSSMLKTLNAYIGLGITSANVCAGIIIHI